MGLLDSMFGGGTNLALTLDTTTSSPGSVVGGRVVLSGGTKPLRLTELKVSLLYVRVQTREGQSLPDIDAREVAHQVVAAGGDVPPGSQQQFTFRITVPGDLPPSAHNVSYTVVATADIPSVKDPSAKADLKVIEASKNANHRLPLQEIEARFPNLRSQDEDALCDALRDFFLACYSEGAQLMEAEQLIAWYMQHGTVRVRRCALEAWANLVDNRVQPQHLQTLYAVANTPGLDDDDVRAGDHRRDEVRRRGRAPARPAARAEPERRGPREGRVEPALQRRREVQRQARAPRAARAGCRA